MRLSFVISLLSMSIFGITQNLVLNPSFEDTIVDMLPPVGQVDDDVAFWNSPTAGTPDYYNSNYNGLWSSARGVSQNWGGGQWPVTGNAYVGVASFCSPGCEEAREYVQGQLNTPLLAGETYCVEFYVSLGDTFQYATDGLGLYFSDTLIHTMPAAPALPCYPQIDTYYNTVITDKTGWTKVSGSYVAQGGEQYVLIGCFKDFASINIDTLTGYHDDAYYYIDSVSVEACIVGIVENEPKAFTRIYPNPTSGSINFEYELNTGEATLTVYDLTGKELISHVLLGGKGIAVLNLEEFNTGIYFYTVAMNSGVIDAGKVIVN